MAQVVRQQHEAAPDHTVLAGQLGDTVRLWDALVVRLTEEFGAQDAWTWAGPRSGWELHFKRAGRPLVTLTPGSGMFTALVVLGQDEVPRAMALTLGEEARRTLEQARQLHDGRWLFLTIENDADLADIAVLASEKLPARLRASLTAAPVGTR